MRPRILIVDDDEMVRNTLSRALTRHGWETATAKDGEDGLYRWYRGHYDVVSTDFDMPAMSGLQLAAAILKKDPGAKVYMFSATPSAKQVALGLGVKGFFDKLEPAAYVEALDKVREEL